MIDAVEREGKELFTIIKMKQGEKQGECREVPSEKELSFVRLAAPVLSLPFTEKIPSSLGKRRNNRAIERKEKSRNKRERIGGMPMELFCI